MITQSQYYLLEAIKASLFNGEFKYPSDINWKEVVDEANAQTVMGLISTVIPVQNDTGEQIKAMYLRIAYEQKKIVECLENALIPCVILKGCAAAFNYPKPYLRTMGDIDVLVPRERFIEALKCLESNGYDYDHNKLHIENVTERTREWEFTKNGILVEIHQRFSSPGVDVDDILEEAINRRMYCDLNGYSFPLLPSPENGLVLLGHINQHLKNNVLGLRQIIDWEMYVHSEANNTLFTSSFIPLAEKTGLLTLAAYVTRLCNLHLGLPDEVQFGVYVDDNLIDELLDVVMTDGNFGRKAYANKSDDDVKIIRASYGINRYGLFGYFTRAGLDTSSFCKKHSSIKILAFFYGLFRQLGMGIKALMRNKRFGKDMGEGQKIHDLHEARNDLYQKLGVRKGNRSVFEAFDGHEENHLL